MVSSAFYNLIHEVNFKVKI